MKTLAWLLGIIVVLLAGFYALDNAIMNSEDQSGSDAGARTLPVTVIPIEHASGILEWDANAIYFDPTGDDDVYSDKPSANIVLVTDIHGDHLSTSTLAAVVGDAPLVVPQAVFDTLPAEIAERATVVRNGESVSLKGFRIEATPMYNLPEAANADRHTKGRGNGYLIERDGVRVLIAGDTAGTPELRAMRDIDIALIPMNLPYTMGVEEAADAVLEFKPRVVYPYHYRTPEGLADVDLFKRLVNAGDPSIEVVLAAWYPRQ